MRYLATLTVFLLAATTTLGATDPLRLEDSDAVAWRWTAKLMSWGPTNSGVRSEFDRPEPIERRVRELKELGVTVTQLNGLHWRNAHMDAMPNIKRYTRMLVDACHKAGIKVAEHHSTLLTGVRGQSSYGVRMFYQHPDWLARDVQYDDALTTYCINNPDFREYFFDYLRDYVRETDVDALQLDEINFCGPRACGCAHCRAKFKRDTGVALPDDDGDSFYEYDAKRYRFKNMNDPRVVAFIQWRTKCIVDFLRDVRREVNKVKPAVSLMIYSTHYGLVSYWPTHYNGDSLFAKAAVCDWLGTEIMSRNVYACPRAIHFYRKAMGSMGDELTSPIFAYVYHMHNPTIAKAGWALCAMNRQEALMDPIAGADMRYVGWGDRMSNRFAKPLSDIAVVFSEATRVWNKLAAYVPDLGGTSESLSDAHIQHDIISERSLRLEALRKYRLVILPRRQLPERRASGRAARLCPQRRPVARVGPYVVVQRSGRPAQGFRAGGSAERELSGLHQANLKLVRDGRGVSLPQAAFRVKVIDPSRSRVLATVADGQGNTVTPGVVETPYGKGWVYYDGVRLGACNYEDERTLNQKVRYERNEALHAEFVNVARTAYGETMPFRADGLTRKVFVTVCRQKAAGRDQVAVNLFNATGSQYAKGDTVTTKTIGNAWPKLAEDIRFDLALPAVASAYVASPDYEGRRPVRVESREGRQYVTVSRDDLVSFCTVYLNLN